MSNNFRFIDGGTAQDARGQIRYVNDFDMATVKRFYIITNTDTEVVRGWRAHRIEQRWFYVIAGAFTIYLVKIDDWKSPSKDLEVFAMELNALDGRVLCVPNGYATAFKAESVHSQLLVFADYMLDHAVNDNHVWPMTYFDHFHKYMDQQNMQS